jgi:hypothetical protein
VLQRPLARPSHNRVLQSVRDSDARAAAAAREAGECSASLLRQTEDLGKLQAALAVKDRQIGSLMALNER